MEQPWRVCFLLVGLLSAHLDTGGSLRSRIVGGGEAKPHARTYAAALKGGGGFRCGGFLVAPQWVLTAAHCNGDISVILGAHDLKAVENTQQVFGVKSYHQHPGYTVVGGTPFNDILLLKGDSGSALVCNGVAHGIVSYGFQIPPSVYTRVAAYLPWIKQTMKEE